MKIFVSYARVDKPFCIRIVETLHAHDIWYDQRLYAGQHWWKEIMRRLDWCDIFVYLLSPDSVNSMYCQKELEVARRLNRPILPILIDSKTEIPATLEDFQYLDMTSNLTADNVAMLLNSVLLIEREYTTANPPEKIELSTQETEIPAVQPGPDMIRNAAKAMHDGDYDNAIVLLKQAKANGFESRFINIESLIKIAEDTLFQQARLKEAEREYEYIESLFAYEATHDFACETLAIFKQEFPDYDPKNLGRFCKFTDSPDTLEDFFDEDMFILPNSDEPEPEEGDKLVLNMLKWCSIPSGVVEVSSVETDGEHFGDKTEHIDAFALSKYPVTNGQFDVFVNAEDGYLNSQWWNFSKYAREWFDESGEAQESRFLGDERPRETVNWYEAMAFCNWLSYKLDMKITLPTVAQWQRAAQGDDARFFPWGNDYHKDYCNTHESKLKMTTPVNQYHKGVSPYDVYDMAGNVWEWTMDMAEPMEESPDYRRSVIGGSFVSPCNRAQVSFRYFLDPRVRYASIGFRLARTI